MVRFIDLPPEIVLKVLVNLDANDILSFAKASIASSSIIQTFGFLF